VPTPISFELITPAGLVFSAQVFKVLLPTAQGQIGVLPHHRPLVTLVVPGVITIARHKDSSDEEYIATSGGFAQIHGSRVRLLADHAERAEDIDELAAQEALHRAQDLRKNAKDQVSLADALSLIEQNTARLKVAELRRRRRG
jgi:F-type H+-transporting ATPase subunit epsilon